MKEIRVYYESLEQAEHYIKPIIETALKEVENEAEIKLVRRIKNAKEKKVEINSDVESDEVEEVALPKYFADEKSVLRAIYSLVVPDILITGVYTDEADKAHEVPLLIIEFTEAVKTEDHEFQRSYGAVAAMFAKCFYVKIASRKEPEKKFGGAPIDPYTIPRSFREQLNYDGFIHCEWETEADNPLRLQTLPGFFGCPPRIKIFEETLKSAVIAFTENKIEWFKQAIERLQGIKTYQDYAKCVSAAQSLEQKLAEWKQRETGKTGETNKKKKKETTNNRVRFYVRDDSIAAKIYRFGHAMDPDRGIVTFISAMFSTERKVFGIYSLVRPKSDAPGEDFLKKPLTQLSELEDKLRRAFDKDEQSVPAWFENALLEKAAEAVAENLPFNAELDITDVILKNKGNISGRVIMTICYFLDGLYLNHPDCLKITWDRFRLLETTRADFLNALRRKFGFDVPSKPIPIRLLIENCDEDEITYTVVHRVLLPNKFRVVSVSYPGAQGGAAVLPEPGTGRKQKRNYLDVVAFPPLENKAEFDVLLDENKGMFAAKKVEDDIEKLKKYRNDATYKTALQTALIRAKVFSPDGKLRDIAIGVGFGVKENNRTSWNPADVDFIFRVKERTSWQIGIFRQDLARLIPTVEGKTDFPACYEIVPREKEKKTKRNKITPLFG